MELKQQSQFPSPIKKRIPPELLFDIFKTINTYLYGPSPPIDLIVNNEANNDTKIIKQRQWWSKYATNIMTSSSIIYFVVGKAFRNCKIHFPMPATTEDNACSNCKLLEQRIVLLEQEMKELKQQLSNCTCGAVKGESSTLKESETKIGSPKKDLGPCKVCNKYSANGKHYGVVSCPSCYGFFAKCIKERRKLTCRKQDDKCIEKGDLLCQSCRFGSCLNAGMDPNAVKKITDENIVTSSPKLARKGNEEKEAE